MWRVALESGDAQSRAAGKLLSADEQQRATRLRIDAARSQFVVARAATRAILARYVGRDPRTLSFAYGSNGKPFLAEPDPPTGVQFNVTHSGLMALVAVARGRAVGVDVERHRPGRDHVRLARRYFHPDEAAALDNVAHRPADHQRCFFDCWCAKEACLKAGGGGITTGLRTFAVGSPSDGNGTGGPLPIRSDDPGLARWVVHRLQVGQGFSAAVAFEPPDVPVVTCEWAMAI